jgi:hypothetical protein
MDASTQDPVHISSFHPIPGYAGAVATRQEHRNLRLFNFDISS